MGIGTVIVAVLAGAVLVWDRCSAKARIWLS